MSRQVKTTLGTYGYFADGTRLLVINNNEMSGFDYLGSLTYKSSSAGLQLESASFGDGMIRANVPNGGGSEVNYFLADHLGSIRVVVDGSGVVKERNDYYPFGSKHVRGDYLQLVANRYKYNGKEEQVTGDLDYLDYGARMYDSGLGRWFGIDPKAEKYLSKSPYHFSDNIPNLLVEVDGRFYDWYRNAKGEISYNENIFSQQDLDRLKIDGTYLGKTYVEDNMYYSLFGEIFDLNSDVGIIIKQIDCMFMKYAKYVYSLREYEHARGNGELGIFDEPPTSPTVDFDLGFKLKKYKLVGHDNNIYKFKYGEAEGYYFVFEKETMKVRFTWNFDKLSLNKTISGQGIESGYNVSMYSVRFPKQDVILLVYPTLKSKNKFVQQWRKEFQL